MRAFSLRSATPPALPAPPGGRGDDPAGPAPPPSPPGPPPPRAPPPRGVVGRDDSAGRAQLHPTRASAPEVGQLLGNRSPLLVTGPSGGGTQRHIHRVGAEQVLRPAFREDRLHSA